MSTQARTEELLAQTGALKTGHFLLSSGLHSDRYCQCAALFEQPRVAEELTHLMGSVLPKDLGVQTVLTPAIGGILWGYELAKLLGAKSLFAEREPGGPFMLRRGFFLEKGERVLLAEDVVTTGKSVQELLPLIEAAGAVVVGYAAIADRSAGKFQPAQPFWALARLDFKTYKAEDCPMCAAGGKAVKPGSRAI